METHKFLLSIGVWVLWVVGVLCIIIGMALFMIGKTPLEFGIHGLGGGAFVTLSAVVAWLRRKL